MVLWFCLSVGLSVCGSVCLSVGLSVCGSVCLWVCLSVGLSMCSSKWSCLLYVKIKCHGQGQGHYSAEIVFGYNSATTNGTIYFKTLSKDQNMQIWGQICLLCFTFQIFLLPLQ